MNANMTDAMLRYGIGLNPWFFERMDGKPKFPPHNVYHVGENRYRLTLAVAGYTQPELKVTLQGELLTVAGTKQGSVQKATGEWTDDLPLDDDKPPTTTSLRVLYQGIAFRNFSAEFLIGSHVRVDAVTLKNGLLDVDLVREVPENEKLKVIAITATE